MNGISDNQAIALLDSMARFSAFGILVLTGALVLRDARGSWAGRFTGAFTLTSAGYLLCSHTDTREALGTALPLLLAVCLAGPGMLWLAAWSIFVDGFTPRYWHGVVLIVLEATGFAALLYPQSGMPFAFLHQALTFGLYGHATFMAWRGIGGDLIEARRDFRLVFVGSVTALSLVISGVETAFVAGTVPAGLETLGALAVLIMAFTLAWLAVRIEPSRVFLLVSAAGDDPAPAPAQSRPAANPADSRTLDRIIRAMEKDQLYRESGLTISALAKAIDAPEHHARRVINRALGYRNFNAFLNHYRIEHVKAALADSARARIPVLTLALDAGYGSLAPFNRAFKEASGLTPTAYRHLRLGAAFDVDSADR
jgi:AraC-like DNA-binding protein